MSPYRTAPPFEALPELRPEPPTKPIDQRRWIRLLGLEDAVESGLCSVRVLSVERDTLRCETRVVYVVEGPDFGGICDREEMAPDEVWWSRSR